MKALDSPQGFAGVITSHGGTCATCSVVYEFPRPFAGTHHARKYLKAWQGWRYHPRWGWVCKLCLKRMPSLTMQSDEAYRKTTGREPTKGPRRVSIQLSFKPPMK